MPEKIVTRFAPSPTGYLHVGGARTALFNWLWARRTGGKFILRIEDTDQKRNTPTAARQVMEDLKWLGIEWDEGPEYEGRLRTAFRVQRSAKHAERRTQNAALNGPYLQSQRRDIYDRYIKQLLDQGKAYYCFDTPEELDALRSSFGVQRSECCVPGGTQNAVRSTRKGGFTYTRPAEFPSAEDAEKARAAGRPVTVRFAVPNEAVAVQDIVRGVITFAAGEIGDFIIQKSDGFPTYNFACVVDDYLMKVTHIIRGQEHLNNTPGQQALWQALFGDTALPKYAHMSVTVSDSGGKLSKRERPKALRTAIKASQEINLEKLAEAGNISRDELDSFIKGKTTPDMPIVDSMAQYLGVHLPEINIVDFFKSGYLPEAMVNFLALLGWNPGDNREIMALDELIEAFDLSRLTKANSLFDRQKLIAFNTEHIRMTPESKRLEHFKDYLEEVKSPVIHADDRSLLRILKLCEGARTLADIERKCRFLYIENEEIEYDDKAVKKVLLKSDGLGVLAIVRDRLAAMDELTEQTIENMLRSLAEEKQVGLGKVAQPLRVAICGTTVSLPIFDSIEMLGKENSLTRIDTTLRKFETYVNEEQQ